MDYLKFETLDFQQRKGGGGVELPKNVFSVTTNGRNTSKVRFSKELTKEIEQFKYLSVKRNPMTSQDYLVFNNNAGMNICYNKKDVRAGVACKAFCIYLRQKYGNGKEKFHMKISENKSNSADYATYEIIGKTEK